MKRIILSVFVAFIFIVPTVVARTHRVEYDVTDGIVHVREDIFLEHTNQTAISFFVVGDAYNIRAWTDSEYSRFQIDEDDGWRTISVNISDQTKNLSLEYMTSEPLDIGETSYFVQGFTVDERTENISLKLTLPEGAVLSRPLHAPRPPVNPEPTQVTTTGRRITIEWDLEELEPEDVFSIFVSYETERFDWLYMVPFFVVLGALIVFFYYRTRKVGEVVDSFTHLLDKEKKIVRALAKADDMTMWQKKLEYETGFTKSKLSRTLRNLEERNVVEKIPYGTSNKVRLILEKEPEESEN